MLGKKRVSKPNHAFCAATVEGRPGVGDGERVRIGEDDRLGEEVAHRLRVREGGRVRVGENERRRWG